MTCSLVAFHNTLLVFRLSSDCQPHKAVRMHSVNNPPINVLKMLTAACLGRTPKNCQIEMFKDMQPVTAESVWNTSPVHKTNYCSNRKAWVFF